MDIVKKKKLFLKAFTKTGVLAPTCEKAGITRALYRQWIKDDKTFKEACQDAQENAVDEAEVELRRRAIYGTKIQMQYQGNPVWLRDPDTGELILDDDFMPIPFTTLKQSDRLLEVYTKAHRPIYKDRSDLSINKLNKPPSQIKVTFIDVDKDKDESDI